MGEYPKKGGESLQAATLGPWRIAERLEVIGECKVKEQEQEHRTTHATGS